MSRFSIPKILLPLIAGMLLFVSSGCEQKPPVITNQFLAFGTLVDLTLAGVDDKKAQEATDILEQDFAEMHRAWHAWDPGPLGRVNRLISEGETFSVPPSVLTLIKIGTELSQRSDHLFNPAIGHLIDAWGFHSNDPDDHQPPDPELIATLLAQNPRMSDLQISDINLHSNNPYVKLDFGAFGKGYGISLAITHLKQLGIENAIVNAGGDLQAIGSKNGSPWRIGIRHPDGEGVIATIETQGDESIFTSGNYERYFTWEGKRFHHIIDPRTGYPAEGTRSVTVIDSDATRADAAATALFIAGPNDWFRIAKNMGISHVLLFDEQGNVHMTPAMADRVKLDTPEDKVIISQPINPAE